MEFVVLLSITYVPGQFNFLENLLLVTGFGLESCFHFIYESDNIYDFIYKRRVWLVSFCMNSLFVLKTLLL